MEAVWQARDLHPLHPQAMQRSLIFKCQCIHSVRYGPQPLALIASKAPVQAAPRRQKEAAHWRLRSGLVRCRRRSCRRRCHTTIITRR